MNIYSRISRLIAQDTLRTLIGHAVISLCKPRGTVRCYQV